MWDECRFANPWTLIRLILLIISSKENQTKPRSFERIFMVSIEKRVPLKFSGIIFYYNKGFRTQFEHESRFKNWKLPLSGLIDFYSARNWKILVIFRPVFCFSGFDVGFFVSQ